MAEYEVAALLVQGTIDCNRNLGWCQGIYVMHEHGLQRCLIPAVEIGSSLVGTKNGATVRFYEQHDRAVRFKHIRSFFLYTQLPGCPGGSQEQEQGQKQNQNL